MVSIKLYLLFSALNKASDWSEKLRNFSKDELVSFKVTRVQCLCRLQRLHKR